MVGNTEAKDSADASLSLRSVNSSSNSTSEGSSQIVTPVPAAVQSPHNPPPQGLSTSESTNVHTDDRLSSLGADLSVEKEQPRSAASFAPVADARKPDVVPPASADRDTSERDSTHDVTPGSSARTHFSASLHALDATNPSGRDADPLHPLVPGSQSAEGLARADDTSSPPMPPNATPRWMAGEDSEPSELRPSSPSSSLSYIAAPPRALDARDADPGPSSTLSSSSSSALQRRAVSSSQTAEADIDETERDLERGPRRLSPTEEEPRGREDGGES